MQKKRNNRIIKALLSVFLMISVAMPISIAYAETPTDSSIVAENQGYVLGDTYQRHSWYSDGRHWVFWSNDSQIVYTSSADLLTWETPTLFSNYSCTLGEGCCNGSAFSLFYDVSLDRVDVAYSNVSAANTAIYYKRGRPESDGTIAWGNQQTALNATANITYMHPSICTNTEDYPYIAVMVYNTSATNYEAWGTTSVTKTGVWTGATNSTMNFSAMANTSGGFYYPSVIPVSAGNVSYQYVFELAETGYVFGQCYADYNVSTDIWAYGTAQEPLPATSELIPAEIMRHSEVAFASVNNSDDVYIVCKGNDSVIGTGLFYDRYGDPATPFADDDYLEEADIIATLSVRNALGNLVLTAVNTSDLANIYSADYTQATLSWNTITSVRPTNAQGAYIMSSYDNSNSSYSDYLWLDNGVPFDLGLGCYGCAAPAPTPSTIPASVTTMAWIVILVFGALICLILLGYGAYEVSRGRGNIDLVKAGAIGFVTFVIAAIIVENLL